MSSAVNARTGLSFSVLVAVILGAAVPPVSAQTIQGTATYKERMALPPDAVFEAVLEDASRADAAAGIIARTRVQSPGNPPIAFTITYDPAHIIDGTRYSVRATIRAAGRLLFTSETATPVTVKRGEPAKVSLLLRRAASSGPPAPGAGSAPLEGTSWRLVKFQGSDGTTLTPGDRTKYTIEFAPGGRVTARIDCNRGRGTWKATAPGQLELGPLGLTRMMCPPESLHDQIAKQWQNIRSYVIRGGHLFLALMADGGIYEFEPAPPAGKL